MPRLTRIVSDAHYTHVAFVLSPETWHILIIDSDRGKREREGGYKKLKIKSVEVKVVQPFNGP